MVMQIDGIRLDLDFSAIGKAAIFGQTVFMKWIFTKDTLRALSMLFWLAVVKRRPMVVIGLPFRLCQNRQK